MPISKKPTASSRTNWTLLLLLLIPLTNCAEGISDPTVCPPIVEYTDEFQDRAYLQYADLPPGSPIVRMIDDYRILRNEIRACQR